MNDITKAMLDKNNMKIQTTVIDDATGLAPKPFRRFDGTIVIHVVDLSNLDIGAKFKLDVVGTNGTIEIIGEEDELIMQCIEKIKVQREYKSQQTKPN